VDGAGGPVLQPAPPVLTQPLIQLPPGAYPPGSFSAPGSIDCLICGCAEI
jgi:hypothetical protein